MNEVTDAPSGSTATSPQTAGGGVLPIICTLSVSFVGDVSVSTDGAGTVYWMITASDTASAEDIIAGTGAITDGSGSVNTVDGAASVELPALGTGDRWFHAVLCHTGTTSPASNTDVEKIQGATAAAYSFLGANEDAGTGTVAHTFSVDVGAEDATRYILVACGLQNGSTGPTVTVGGTSLSKIGGDDPSQATNIMFFGGLVPTGTGSQNVVKTWGSLPFAWKVGVAWKMTNLLSTTHRNLQVSGDNSFTIPVGAGEFMFYGMNATRLLGGTLAAATEAPARGADFGGHGHSADWEIAATNSAFTIPQDDLAGVRRGIAVTFS